jgi:membrane protease YdiL (CAAX protease family)
MQEASLAFATPATTARWKRYLVYSPLARIVIFVLAMALIATLLGVGMRLAFGAAARVSLDSPVGVATYLVTMPLPAVLAYLLLVRVVEQRPVRELSWRRLPRGLALGVLAGLLLFSSVVGVLWLLGSYHVTGLNPTAHWLLALLSVGLGAGIGEEIITRGVLFRIVEEGLGSGWALLLSALFFGFAHGHNPGATMWSSAAIAIEAGLLFALIYHLTRSLWPCIGLHAAWNFAQGTIYGIPVSGNHADGWLVSSRSGPDWLSGGNFGAEASVVALLLCSTCSLVLLVIALRRGSFVPPSWRRG